MTNGATPPGAKVSNAWSCVPRSLGADIALVDWYDDRLLRQSLERPARKHITRRALRRRRRRLDDRCRRCGRRCWDGGERARVGWYRRRQIGRRRPETRRRSNELSGRVCWRVGERLGATG